MSKKITKKIIFLIVTVIISIGLVTGIKRIVESYALESNWYTEYTYEIDYVNKTINLMKFNGTTTDINLPSTVSIDNNDYSVVINGNIYADNKKITSVKFENGVKAGNSLTDLFKNCSNLKSVDMSLLNTSETLTMDNLFFNCTSLNNVKFGNMDTSKVTTMEQMFYGCRLLTKIDVSSFNTSNVKSFVQMFPDNMQEIKFGSNFKFNSPDTFGRGTWVRKESGTKYAAVDLVLNSQKESIAGTYTKIGNTIDAMNIDFDVDYFITKPSKIDNYYVTDDTYIDVVDNKYVILKNLPVPSSGYTDNESWNDNEFSVDQEVILLFYDNIYDRDGNNNYFMEFAIDNIRIYNLAELEDYDKFGAIIFDINELCSELYPWDGQKLDTNTLIYKDSSISYDVSIRILSYDGLSPSGNFAFSAYDLDTSSYMDGINGEKGFGRYSEGIEFYNKNYINNLILHPNTFLQKIGNRITGTKVGDQKSELTEFILQAPASGFEFTWTGEACRTEIFSIYHQIVEFSKVSVDFGNELSGAHLELYDDEGDLITSWISGGEPKKIPLMPGNYIVKEIVAPNGYMIGENISFTIDTDGVYINNILQRDGRVVISNEISEYSYTINYYDKENGILLDTRQYKASYDSIIKGEEHIIDIPSYIYDSMDKVEITIRESGNEINIYYVKQSYEVIISKQDTIGNELPGAKLELYNHQSSLVESWISTTTNKKINLSPGKYVLKEVTAPIHYEISENIEFEVDTDGKILIHGNPVSKIIISNELKKYEYTINYFDKETNSLLDSKTGEAMYNSKILSEEHKLDFRNYIYDSTDKEELIVKESNNIINIYYVKKASGLIEKHINEFNNTILDSKDYSLSIGETYSTTSKEFDGFVLVKKPENATGTISEEITEVIYYYRKVFKINTNVNSEGGTIVGDETVYEGYDSTSKNIVIKPQKGYVIESITINGENIDVIDETGMILDNFIEMQEDKNIIVKFKQVVIDVPITDSNTTIFIVAALILIFGIVFIIFHKKIFEIILKR